jgi:hypothetical protein
MANANMRTAAPASHTPPMMQRIAIMEPAVARFVPRRPEARFPAVVPTVSAFGVFGVLLPYKCGLHSAPDFPKL